METTNGEDAGRATMSAEQERQRAKRVARLDEMSRLLALQRHWEEELLPLNKAALFDALAAAGIATATVTFNGSGDEGQIEEVAAHAGNGQPRDLPGGAIEHKEIGFGDVEPTISMIPVRGALENLAYALLGQTHDGWENGDGAHGEFTFDVAARSITLGFHERYIETNYHEHEF